MKKFYLFILILTCTLVQAQTTTTTTASGTVTASGSVTTSGSGTSTNSTLENKGKYYNAWRFGINLGATWETSDIRSTPGFAGGFTLEKGFCENKTNFLSWALKGRALFGTAYGLDYTRNYDVKFNPALNGTYNKAINYDSTSSYVYNNYRTEIGEGALEFQICFNSLRERTNILLNLWGGIGFTSYRAKTNLLDGDQKMYNYYAVDSSGGSANIISSHKFLLDKSYESNARNSQNGNVLTWSPSCGVGLGYRFNDYVSILWEYKLTFPQGSYSDYMDGIKASNNDWLGCTKDYYHYTCVNFLFKLGKGKKKTETANNVNNYTPANTNTVVGTNSVTTTQPVIQKPIVSITNPPSSPYNFTAGPSFTVMAKVYNVNQRSEVYVTFNGTEIKNYSWFGKTISFVAPLSIGNNIVSVTATNAAGSDSKSAIINYSGVPPLITITTPGVNQHVTTQNIQDIYATILNVQSASNIFVKLNSVNYSSFSYNPADHVLFMQLPLVKGTNTVEITATNVFGQDIKSQLIIYNQQSAVVTATATGGRPPSVVILDPNPSPKTTDQQTYIFKAKTTMIANQNQMVVKFNGLNVSNYSFNPTTGLIDFACTLTNNSNNIFEVTVTNSKGSQNASAIVKQEEVKSTEVSLDPDITICHNRNGTKQTMVIKQSEWAGHQQHGDVMGECPKETELGTDTGNSPDITICHKNADGSNQTIVIKQKAWAQHQAHGDVMGTCPKIQDPGSDVGLDPDITICHNNSNGTKQTIVVKQSAWVQHQSHGDVMGTCPKIQDPGSDVGLDPDITICHNNSNGTKQTIVVKQSTWAQHQSHGDVMGTCPKIQDPGSDVGLDPDITICHKNGDGTEVKMTIKQSQWASHQAHGDYQGENCATQTNTVATTLIQICHKSATGSTQTMTISSAAWPIHQAHGDVLGVCIAQSGNSSSAQTNTIVICHKKADSSVETMTISSTVWPIHQAHGDVLGVCPTQSKTLNPEEGGGKIKESNETNDGSKVPGRTKTTESEKTEEPKTGEPKKEEGKTLKPR